MSLHHMIMRSFHSLSIRMWASVPARRSVGFSWILLTPYLSEAVAWRVFSGASSSWRPPCRLYGSGTGPVETDGDVSRSPERRGAHKITSPPVTDLLTNRAICHTLPGHRVRTANVTAVQLAHYVMPYYIKMYTCVCVFPHLIIHVYSSVHLCLMNWRKKPKSLGKDNLLLAFRALKKASWICRGLSGREEKECLIARRPK